MIQSSSSAGEATVLKFIGRLNFAGGKSFQNSIKAAQAAGAKSITLNLEQVSYIDSAGLGLLMLAQKELSEAGISFSLSHPQERVLKLLDLTKISELIPIQLGGRSCL